MKRLFIILFGFILLINCKFSYSHNNVINNSPETNSNEVLIKNFHPGEIWTDMNGKHINAHGGGVIFYEGKYYWIGEHKDSGTSNALAGIRMYSSEDLYNWKDEGIVLAVDPENSGSDIEKGCIMERPKVVYNKKTGKFVIWFHLELKNKGYKAARYAVATSDKITGPYRMEYSARSCKDIWPLNMSLKERSEAIKSFQDKEESGKENSVLKGKFVARDLKEGQMSRDMTIFVDDDGKAYHIFSSEENATLHIAELSDDYLYHSGKWIRILPGRSNEAPAIMKKDGKYWLITSGCTGWAPNKARLAVSESIWGPWKELPNPCRGLNAEKTFNGQSTYILKVEGKKDSWIFMADIWKPENQLDSRYIWLPIEFENNVPVINWNDEWGL
ncbi:MAG: glycoside hydrolase family 43 protein [Bacteroidales bacterium]|nr:glycoside hydrolase family 43 protein [Bacteroidales bacterium]